MTVLGSVGRAIKVDVKDLETVSREFPERYESQSNGMIEVDVKIFRGHFRTMKSCLQTPSPQ